MIFPRMTIFMIIKLVCFDEKYKTKQIHECYYTFLEFEIRYCALKQWDLVNNFSDYYKFEILNNTKED